MCRRLLRGTSGTILQKFPAVNIKAVYKLKELGIQNAIFGKAFYEENISFDDIKNYIKN